ncbi:MAG: 4Fe-4S dicluster domain-containing protein [Deltaproteobacteria bacterium]|nr:4Fe-4S dicluster domain-containing protein [Deltaproteobacteria bacterium]
MSDGKISYQPTKGLSYDPNDPVYWDEALLDEETKRVFEVCHGCRMCFKYCDSFPKLFAHIDERHDGDVKKLAPAETQDVMDACFQCKLCEVQCPYTPRDQHEFQLDFPKLVARHRAVHAKKKGIRLRDRILGNPDGTAKFARASLGVANVMNRVAVHRWFMEKVLGVHRKKLLPSFARKTFEHWAKKAGKLGPPGGEVALFQTCYVQHNEPQIGRDTVEVLEKNGVDVRCVKGLECCGMPAWESGDLDAFRKHATRNLDRLEPYVDAGAKVAAINPTCSMMLRREYPELVAPADKARAEKVAAAVVDPGELLWSLRNEPRFSTDFKSSPHAKVAYHAPCHLRAQAVGFKGRDLLRKIPGVVPGTVIECCGHDGTYAMKVEGFETSIRVGQKAFTGMKDQAVEVWATDCPLAALQFQQHAGVKPMHPMSILAAAYRGDAFPGGGPVAPKPAPEAGEQGEKP